MRALAYLRVSTEEQSVEAQKMEIERWASAHGVTVLKYYSDVVSGSVPAAERPGFKQMVEDARREKPDLIVVYELSRIARSLSDLFSVLNLLERDLGIALVSVSPREQFLSTLDRTVRRFVLAALGFAVEMERELIRQRTKSAMERWRREVDEATADKIAEMYRAGNGIRAISSALGISTYLVRRTLAERGLIRPPEGTCPRCFSRMRLVDSAVRGERVVKRYYCPHCGNEVEV